MALDLCEEDEYVECNGQREPWFGERKGILKELIRETGEAEKIIFTAGAVLERRAYSSKKSWNGYFDTVSSIVYPVASGLPLAKQKFKVCPYSSRLAQIGQDSLVVGGGLMIPSYEEIREVEFKRGDVILERNLNEREASEHPLLLEHFEGNRELLGRCVQRIFKKGKDEYGYKKMMGIYLAQELAQSHERAFYVSRLDGNWWSWAIGVSSLDDGDGRLVGVAPEALVFVENRYPDLYRLLCVDEQRKAIRGAKEEARGIGIARQGVVVPTPAPILDTMGIEISDVYVKMPTEAEQRREDLRRMIENVHLDEETYLKLRKELEGKK